MRCEDIFYSHRCYFYWKEYAPYEEQILSFNSSLFLNTCFLYIKYILPLKSCVWLYGYQHAKDASQFIVYFVTALETLFCGLIFLVNVVFTTKRHPSPLKENKITRQIQVVYSTKRSHGLSSLPINSGTLECCLATSA